MISLSNPHLANRQRLQLQRFALAGPKRAMPVNFPKVN